MEPSRFILIRPRLRPSGATGLALVLAAVSPALAQRSEGGDFGASDQGLRSGALAPQGAGPVGAPPPPIAPTPVVKPTIVPPPKPAAPRKAPTPDPAIAVTVDDNSDPTRPAAMLPPPQSFMSSAWSFWPHAWAYVPSLWSTWYRDYALQSRSTTAAEPAGPENPAAPSGPPPEPGAPLVTPLAPQVADLDMQKLPPPTLIRRRRYNLVIGGVGLLAATWAADRLLARDLSPKPETWVPLVGPWFLLGEQTSLAAPNVQVEILLIADGLLQAAGLTMSLLGFVLTTKRYQVAVQPARTEFIPRETQ